MKLWLSFYHKRAEEFKNVTCLGENTEKYINFTVPIEKSYKNWKIWGRNYKKYILYFTVYW